MPSNVLKDFWDSVLAGESKTYNDHNWYTSGGLKGFIEGRSKSAYPLLKKPLSEYTIGEVKSFQSRPRDGTGQLWATGRYQIIPNTLKGVVEKVGLSDNDLYSVENQDKLAVQLLLNRKNLSAYLKGEVPDTLENRQKASLDMAMIWSSIGVPYSVKGRSRSVNKDESYYSGGGDKASVKSDIVMEKLQMLRNRWNEALSKAVKVAKERPLLVIVMTASLTLAIYVLYKQLIAKK